MLVVSVYFALLVMRKFTTTIRLRRQRAYEIVASFAGDDSYGSSGASTGITVGAAPVVTQAPTASPIVLPPFEMYTFGAAGLVIIAIAIATILILRKRP